MSTHYEMIYSALQLRMITYTEWIVALGALIMLLS